MMKIGRNGICLGAFFWLVTLLTVDSQENNKRAALAARRVTPGLKKVLHDKDLEWGAPVFIRIFKEERELELWIQKEDTFRKFRTYPIAAMSGVLGPKLAEGDKQAPEGFYYVPPTMMNPRSLYHLSFNIGFPNAYDRSHGRTGSLIMVHGDQRSIGCFAMTDPKIEEIYTLCAAAFQEGQPFFRVHCFPFRMTSERMLAAKGHPWEAFWKNLQEGYRWFEDKKSPPNVEFEAGSYLFEADSN